MPRKTSSHPRSAGTFSRFLRVYVRESGKLTLMQAIEKATLITACIIVNGSPIIVEGKLLRTARPGQAIRRPVNKTFSAPE
jgi:hypothetical protein